MQELYTQIAEGFVEISNGMMEDLAKVFGARTEAVGKEIMRLQKKRQQQRKPVKGFTG